MLYGMTLRNDGNTLMLSRVIRYGNALEAGADKDALPALRAMIGERILKGLDASTFGILCNAKPEWFNAVQDRYRYHFFKRIVRADRVVETTPEFITLAIDYAMKHWNTSAYRPTCVCYIRDVLAVIFKDYNMSMFNKLIKPEWPFAAKITTELLILALDDVLWRKRVDSYRHHPVSACTLLKLRCSMRYLTRLYGAHFGEQMIRVEELIRHRNKEPFLPEEKTAYIKLMTSDM
jgi:hypothetical protein